MATTRIMIENGTIVDYSDRYFCSLSEDGKEYVGNGWVVKIKDGHNGRPGRIICHAEREYSDGPAVCHREFRLADGVLGLAGGNIYSRYAYFRTPEFCDWLSDHELQCVKREDPNQTYYSRNPVSNHWSHDLRIETDGEVERSYEEGQGERYQISGATYVVTRQRYCDGVRWHLDSGVLYTLVKDVTTITGIFSKKAEEEMKLRQDKLIAANAFLKEQLERVLAPYQGEGGGCPSLAAATAVENVVNSKTRPTVRDKEFTWFCWSYGSDSMFDGRCLFCKGEYSSWEERNGEFGAKKSPDCHTDFSRHREITDTIRQEANPKTYGEVFQWVEEHKDWLKEDISIRKTFYRVTLSEDGLKVRVEYVRTFWESGDEWIWRQFEPHDPRWTSHDDLEILWEGEAAV